RKRRIFSFDACHFVAAGNALMGFITTRPSDQTRVISITLPKAVEHHRAPRRKRAWCTRNGGHVVECGGVPPLLERRVALFDNNPTDPETKYSPVCGRGLR